MRSRSSSFSGLKIVTVAVLTIALCAGSAFAGNGHAPAAKAKALSTPLVPAPTITPAFTYSAASMAAGGVSLRNRASSTINLSSLPTDAVVIKAFLYWDFTSLTSATSKQSTICFGKNQEQTFKQQCDDNNRYQGNDNCQDNEGYNGDDALKLNLGARLYSPNGQNGNDGNDGGDQCSQVCTNVSGSQIGSGADACWAGGSNFAFRADVTKFIKGNGRYLVALLPGAASTESGIDPTDPTSPIVGPYAEGATLVVVFSSSIIPNGQVLVYDSGIAGQEFVANAGFFYSLADVPATGSGDSFFTEIGADGQAGEGPLNFATTKVTTLNGFKIAGPGSSANDADWNGSDGWPSIQLWDTHEHDVTGELVTGSNPVGISDSDPTDTDCLIGERAS